MIPYTSTWLIIIVIRRLISLVRELGTPVIESICLLDRSTGMWSRDGRAIYGHCMSWFVNRRDLQTCLQNCQQTCLQNCQQTMSRKCLEPIVRRHRIWVRELLGFMFNLSGTKVSGIQTIYTWEHDGFKLDPEVHCSFTRTLHAFLLQSDRQSLVSWVFFCRSDAQICVITGKVTISCTTFLCKYETDHWNNVWRHTISRLHRDSIDILWSRPSFLVVFLCFFGNVRWVSTDPKRRVYVCVKLLAITW
jgi:hypothetical protein